MRTSLLSFLACLSLASAARAAIPEQIFSCLSAEPSEVELRGDAESEGSTFYYLGIASQESYGIAVVALRNSECELLSAPGEEKFLYEIVPRSAALEIHLENYQYAIEKAGGKEALEELLGESTGGFETYTYYTDIELEALSQLGIEVNDNYTLRSSQEDEAAVVQAFLAAPDPPHRKFINTVRLVGDYAIARWVLFDQSGKMVGQQVEGEWQVLGFTTEEEDPISADSLQSKFGIPLETARELLEG